MQGSVFIPIGTDTSVNILKSVTESPVLYESSSSSFPPFSVSHPTKNTPPPVHPQGSPKLINNLTLSSFSTGSSSPVSPSIGGTVSYPHSSSSSSSSSSYSSSSSSNPAAKDPSASSVAFSNPNNLPYPYGILRTGQWNTWEPCTPIREAIKVSGISAICSTISLGLLDLLNSITNYDGEELWSLGNNNNHNVPSNHGSNTNHHQPYPFSPSASPSLDKFDMLQTYLDILFRRACEQQKILACTLTIPSSSSSSSSSASWVHSTGSPATLSGHTTPLETSSVPDHHDRNSVAQEYVHFSSSASSLSSHHCGCTDTLFYDAHRNTSTPVALLFNTRLSDDCNYRIYGLLTRTTFLSSSLTMNNAMHHTLNTAHDNYRTVSSPTDVASLDHLSRNPAGYDNPSTTCEWNPNEWIFHYVINENDLMDKRSIGIQALRQAITTPLQQFYSTLPYDRTLIHQLLQQTVPHIGLVPPLPRSNHPSPPTFHKSVQELVYDPNLSIDIAWGRFLGPDGHDDTILRNALLATGTILRTIEQQRNTNIQYANNDPHPSHPHSSPFFTYNIPSEHLSPIHPFNTQILPHMTRQQLGNRLRAGLNWSISRAITDPHAIVPAYDTSQSTCALLLPVPLNLQADPDANFSQRARALSIIHVAAAMYLVNDNEGGTNGSSSSSKLRYEVRRIFTLYAGFSQARILGKVTIPWLKGLCLGQPMYITNTYPNSNGTYGLTFLPNASYGPIPPCLTLPSNTNNNNGPFLPTLSVSYNNPPLYGTNPPYTSSLNNPYNQQQYPSPQRRNHHHHHHHNPSHPHHRSPTSFSSSFPVNQGFQTNIPPTNQIHTLNHNTYTSSPSSLASSTGERIEPSPYSFVNNGGSASYQTSPPVGRTSYSSPEQDMHQPFIAHSIVNDNTRSMASVPGTANSGHTVNNQNYDSSYGVIGTNNGYDKTSKSLGNNSLFLSDSLGGNTHQYPQLSFIPSSANTNHSVTDYRSDDRNTNIWSTTVPSSSSSSSSTKSSTPLPSFGLSALSTNINNNNNDPILEDKLLLSEFASALDLNPFPSPSSLTFVPPPGYGSILDTSVGGSITGTDATTKNSKGNSSTSLGVPLSSMDPYRAKEITTAALMLLPRNFPNSN